MQFVGQSAKFIGIVLVLLTVGGALSIAPSAKALAQAPPPQDRSQVADKLYQQAIEHLDRLEFEPANRRLQQALQIAQKTQDELLQFQIRQGLEAIQTIRTNAAKDLEDFQKRLGSQTITTALKQRVQEGLLLGELAHFYYDAGTDDKKAITYREKSLAIAQATQNRHAEMVQLIQLGALYQEQDEQENDRMIGGMLDYDFVKKTRSVDLATKARDYLEQGLKIAQEMNDKAGQLTALEILGRSHAVLGAYQTAIERQKQRLAIVREFPDQAAEAHALNILGVYYRINGHYAESIQQHQAAISIQRSHANSSITPSPLPTLSKAGFGRVAPWVAPSDLKDSLAFVGDAYQASQDYANAVKTYQAALATPHYRYPALEVKILSQLGYTWAKWHKLPEAESTLRAVLTKLETERQDGLSGVFTDLDGQTDAGSIWVADWSAQAARQLQQVLVQQNKTDAALEVAEAARARALVDLLSFRVDQRSNRQESALPKPLTLNEIRQMAKSQNATLVQYAIVTPELLYIWLIKPTGEIIFRSSRLDPKQSLNQLVMRSRMEMGARGRSSLPGQNPPSAAEAGNLAKLYQILIAPIATELPHNPDDRVIFIPQAALFLVPFPALQNAQGQYLIEQHTISTSSSIHALGLTQSQRQTIVPSANVAIVGNPTMPMFESQPLKPLPGSEKEAIALAQLFNTKALIGNQATKSVVLQQIQNAGIVHLATHGLLDTVKGNFPGAIALAPTTEDNGLLSASEIFNLKLNANLVVLSACDTGRGEITGDGVVGLSRSFIAAGVPSVVVSLWAVDDYSTAVLMNHFYRHLKTQPNKAIALRQAMLKTRQQYPNPIDWAAFTLVGAAE
jgi:CHAT domain-containing protein